MHSAILVHPKFDKTWPFAADHFRTLWAGGGAVEFVRTAPEENRPAAQLLRDPGAVTRLVCLEIAVTPDCLKKLTSLREIVISGSYRTTADEALRAELTARGVRLITQPSEGFWGQSVSEFALGLTIAGLRRMPQLYHDMLTSVAPWNYDPPGGIGRPGARGAQYSDDSRFANGTIAGKRIRIVGAGNIASRYAAFCHFLGADVAAWDPFASEPCFHRAGSRREHFLDRLMDDAEIFVPMVPLTDKTRGLITARHIDALPKGTLIVLVTRAKICDFDSIRRRVLADEVSLAADVFDVEPLPPGDPLLGRHNVVHSPHIAGRTRDANQAWAEALADQFTRSIS